MARTCPRCSIENDDIEEFCTGCEFPFADAATLIHNHYRMTRPWVFSSFRAVYQAEDIKDNNRTYSIREFLPHFVNYSEQIVVRSGFESTMKRFSDLSHPNLAGIKDFFIEGNYYYVVYEFVNGLDMTKYLEDHKIITGKGYPERLVSHWVGQMCDLLEYLHHGFGDPFYAVDFKPAGVVFRQEDESIVFIDMGLFKLLEILGPHYIITEDFQAYRKARGKFESIGWDLFCLGNFMYYLLTGIDLIKAPENIRMPLNIIRPDLSPAMLDIVNKAIGKFGQSFYTDIRDIKRDLKEKIPSLPIRAFDFYSDFVSDKLAEKVEWPILLGNVARTSCGGIAPRTPLHLKWTKKMKPSDHYFLCASGDYVYATSKEGIVYCYHKDGGKYEWKTYIDRNIAVEGIASGDTLFFITPKQDLVGIERDQNDFLWKLHIDTSVMSSPALYDDIIFLALYNGTIHAINAIEGNILTSYKVEGNIISNPIIFDNILYVSSLNKMICAIDIDTEETLWVYESETGFSASPSLVSNTLFIGSHDGTLCAISIESGGPIWTRNFRGSITQSVRASENMVYFTTRAGVLTALTPDRGETVWERNLNTEDFEFPFCLGQNTIFIVDAFRNLRCLNSFSGEEKYSLKMSHPTVSQLVIAHRNLYLVSSTGHLAAFGK